MHFRLNRQLGNVVDGAHFICVVQRGHDQRPIVRAHRDEVFLFLDHDLADRNLCRLFHRFVEEPERLLPTLVRREVIGLFVVDRVDLAEVGE